MSTKKPAAKKPAPRRGPAPKNAWERFLALQSKQRWILALKYALVAGMTFVLVGVLGGFLMYVTTDIPDPNKAYQTQTTFVYYNDGSSELGAFAQQNRISITFKEMPATIKAAVVAAEDRSFWSNNGIDLRGIIRAAFKNASGDSLQGASTITQQYVKLLYLNQQRSYTRKIKEAILSLKLQRTMSKEQILEGYLNTVYFGRGAYGIEAASRAYFGHSAKTLGVRESAMLASIINNPNNLDPSDKTERKNLLDRYRYVLQGMVTDGDLTQAKATQYKKDLPPSQAHKLTQTFGDQKGHALRLVENELLKLGFNEQQIEGGGLRITTTLTQKAMDAAEQGVMDQRPNICYYASGARPCSDKDLHIGVAMVEPGTGALKGFYGGQDYLNSQINWATAHGAVGSSMKPVTLATALENGYSLKSTFDGNSPYYYPGAPQNPSSCPIACVVNEGEQAGETNGHSYGRNIQASYALEQSVNTAFIDMTQSIPDGPKKIYETGLAMGIPPDTADPKHPGLPATSRGFIPTDNRITLGAATISPVNMANTYATIAAGGERADVHVVQQVKDASGKVLFQYQPTTTRAIPQDVADDVSYAMQGVVQHGTGRAALRLGRPAAGKTGTATNNNGDVISAWFTGFTPQISVSVMYVRGTGQEKIDHWMPSYFGADYPTRTWTAVTNAYLDGEPTESFPPPANVQGTPPSTGHDFVPPPPPPPAPKPQPKPTKSATKAPTKKPTATATATKTATPPKKKPSPIINLGGGGSPTP